MAMRHMELLAPGETRFTFQMFDDNAERKRKRGLEQEIENERAKKEVRKARTIQDPFAEVQHGTLEALGPLLVRQNRLGAGIYITFNRTDLKGRRTNNVTAIRGVFQEDDYGFKADLPLVPTFEVETTPGAGTSAGKWHCYFLTESPLPADEDARAEFTGMMARMIADFGSDENAKDVARVLRLAGFFHMKREPHLVRLV